MSCEQKYRLKYICCDFVAANLAWFLFTFVRFCLTRDYGHMRAIDSFSTYLSFHDIALGQAIFPFLIIFMCHLSGFYNKPLSKSDMQVFTNTTISTLVSSLVIYFIILINDNLPERNVNYELIVALWGIVGISLYVPREIIFSDISKRISDGHIHFNTFVIGDLPAVEKVKKAIARTEASQGYRIVGTLPFNCNLSSIGTTLVERGVHSLIIAPCNRSNSETMQLISQLFHFGIPIKIAPETYDIITSNIRHVNIIDEPFVNIAQSNMPEWQKNVKRMFDIVSSATALIALSPLFLIVGILIKSDSRGRVFYSQERIGKNGKPFLIYKFRTMIADAEKNGIPMLSNEKDNRVTRTGHFLRKYRIDEIPQFWNVLKGDMSLVGPRPERRFFAEKIIEQAPYYVLTYQIRPGITSWGMVKYGYAKNVDEMIARSKYDLIYLDNMSLFIDFKIIMYTVRTVLTGKGM